MAQTQNRVSGLSVAIFTFLSCGEMRLQSASLATPPANCLHQNEPQEPSGMTRENTTAGVPRKTIWSFDLGKASIGEAVRVESSALFLHRASLLIPAELALRGPSSKSGTPASRYRMERTRAAHWRREEWLDELWCAASLIPLARRTVEPIVGQWTTYQKNVRGKKKLKTRAAKVEWQLAHKGDPRLEREFASEDDPLCYTSCLLRIALLRGGEELAEWQIYKALWSGIQKRGYSDVPWKEQRKGGDDTQSEADAAENARAGQRWEEFLAALNAAGLGDDYQRPCYFDAWHMKLWEPAKPTEWSRRPASRPESTQKVSFPGRVVESELLALATAASTRLEKLGNGFGKWMDGYRARIRARVEKINAYRAEKKKKPVPMPGFDGAANDFAELFVYGPGGKPALHKEARPIASFDPAKRKAIGLRPGTPGDWQAALGQRVARFDNRLQRYCALIPRLNCCRNTSDADLKNAKDGDPRLLPAEVTFLMKIKNMRVQERTKDRTQRGLTPDELRKLFKERSAKREYTFTKNQWRQWCADNNLLPVVDAQDKKKPGAKKQEDGADGEKKKTDYAVDRASTEGRSRFSRPALRLLKKLLLSGNSPSEFLKRLQVRDAELLKQLGPDEKRALEIFDDSKDAKANAANAIKGLFVSDLAFLSRMRKPDAKEDSWDGIYIPTQNLDHVAHEAGADAEARHRAIRELIGMQNNPIVRHRLATFWERLKTLAKLAGTNGQPIGEPATVVIELVRDDPESSWLGKDAKKEMTDAMKAQRDKRDAAKQRLAETGDPHGDVLKFLLWEAQGCQCLYGAPGKGGDPSALHTALSFTGMKNYRVDHIVPRAIGGPDAFYNLILTEDTTNARKGDRTPWQWFHADRSTADWDAYRNRVLSRARELGGRKVRLLLSADAHKLVEHYKPLAETAWIARLARVIVNLHFGWANVSDAEGKQRVLLASGGLTARIRRRYHLDSLLGSDRSLDEAVTALLKEQASHREEIAKLPIAMTERDPRYPRLKEIKARLRELRDALDEKSREAEKQRGDKRHHALDAMVLGFVRQKAADSQWEEELRLTDIGDAPAYPPQKLEFARKLMSEIIALQAVAAKADTVEKREQLQREITGKHDALRDLRQPPNVIAVREAFRRAIYGEKPDGSDAILPRALNFEKPKMQATFHRGVWLPVESEAKVAKATHENFNQAYYEDRIALERLPWLDDGTPTARFCREHAVRRAAWIAPHKDYAEKEIRRALVAALHPGITPEEWQAWCRSDAAPSGIKPKKGQPDTKEFSFFRIEEKRTKRVKLYDLGVGSREIDVYDRTQFEDQMQRLVLKPDSKVKPADIVLGPDTALQEKLRGLLPRIEEFFSQYPPDIGDLPRKPSERAKWKERKEAADEAWKEFIKNTGLDRHKIAYVRADGPKVTDRPYEKAGLRSLLLTKIRRFDPDQAVKQVQSISDAWTRFQLRKFLATDPQPPDWKVICDTFVQVTRISFADFLATEPKSAADFISYYGKQEEASRSHDPATGDKMRSVIQFVQQVIGNADAYVDVSKDGSGIYAKGGNRGYFVWKKTTTDAEGKKVEEFGATAVLGFELYSGAKYRLMSEKGLELLDTRLWQANLILRLPNDTKSGKKTVPAGFYYFGSISNGAYATIKPVAGGDNYDGISIALLLASGIRRHKLL